MLRKTVIASACIAAGLAAAGVIVASTTASSASPEAGHGAAAHATTKHYTARTVSTDQLGKLNGVTNVTLKSRHLERRSKIKGAAEFTCHRKSAAANSERCHGAIALVRGMLYVNAKIPFTTFDLTGKITGGSGVFKGASGRIFAVGNSAKHSLLTIKYKL